MSAPAVSPSKRAPETAHPEPTTGARDLSTSNGRQLIADARTQSPRGVYRSTPAPSAPHPAPEHQKPLPPISRENVDLMKYFGSQGALKSFASLSQHDKRLATDIEELTSGHAKKGKDYSAAQKAIAEIASYCATDSKIVAYRVKSLQAHQASVSHLQDQVRIARDVHKASTFGGKPIEEVTRFIVAENTRLVEARKNLPQGTLTLQNEISRNIQHIKDNGGLKTRDAIIEVRKQFKTTLEAALPKDRYNLTREYQAQLLAIATENGPTKAIRMLSKINDPEVQRWLKDAKPLIERYGTALRYMRQNQYHGYSSALQIEAAKEILTHDNAHRVAYLRGQGESTSAPDVTKAVAALGNSPSRVGAAAEAYVIQSSNAMEKLNKPITVGAMVGASVLTVASGHVYAPAMLAAIWLGPLGSASAARSYVEDKSFMKAASEEWRLNQFFGSPGSAVGEHIAKDDKTGAAWKLLLLDTVAFAAMAGIPSGALRGSLRVSSEQLSALAKHRGWTIPEKDLGQVTREINAGLSTALKDTSFVRQLQNAKTGLAKLPENLRDFVAQEARGMQPVSANGAQMPSGRSPHGPAKEMSPAIQAAFDRRPGSHAPSGQRGTIPVTPNGSSHRATQIEQLEMQIANLKREQAKLNHGQQYDHMQKRIDKIERDLNALHTAHSKAMATARKAAEAAAIRAEKIVQREKLIDKLLGNIHLEPNAREQFKKILTVVLDRKYNTIGDFQVALERAFPTGNVFSKNDWRFGDTDKYHLTIPRVGNGAPRLCFRLTGGKNGSPLQILDLQCLPHDKAIRWGRS